MVHMEQVLVDGLLLHLAEVGSTVGDEPALELGQIAYVGAEGIGGGVLLLSQIVAVCRDKVRHVSLTPLSFKSSLASAMQKAAAPGRTPPLSRSAIQTHR